jgi:hypothetical protein
LKDARTTVSKIRNWATDWATNAQGFYAGAVGAARAADCAGSPNTELTTMQAPVVDRSRWWVVIGYEVEMLQQLINIPSQDPATKSWVLRNSITEGKVLHTRNLCDFCLSKLDSDIKPSDLFDNYDIEQKYQTLMALIEQLRQKYGKDEGSARWAFNKMLAHPTKERGERFEYGPFLDRVLPVLQEIMREIHRLRGGAL